VLRSVQRKLIALWRLLRVVLHLLRGAWTIRRSFPGMAAAQRSAEVQAWAAGMLQRLAIDVQLRGDVARHGPVLLAANHVSWLDIIAIHAVQHCRFVAKSDVKHWPLLGLLATGAGTLYIERESRRDAMRVVHHMADRLRDNEILAVFPEGTTGDGTEVLPFHANLLQAAISAGAPVQAVALRYADAVSGANSLVPCYVGDDSLAASVWRTLCAEPLRVELQFGAVRAAQGRDRRAWAVDLRAEIVQMRHREDTA
jgi:1-acyl-sn-glycerol-3-phosphate acyltransferase